tara:strand:+ start:207 stop:563 length:357 start_codon:yes stop_codon:yes gene_type:complete
MKYNFRKHKKFYNGLFYFAVLTVVFGYGLIAGRFHLFPYMLINKLVKPTALYDYYEKIDPVIANVDVLSLISIKTETDVPISGKTCSSFSCLVLFNVHGRTPSHTNLVELQCLYSACF